MRILALTTAFAFCMSGLSQAADDPRDAYFELTTGSFSSAVQAARDKRYYDIVWHLTEVQPDDPTDARWLYAEQWEQGAEVPYRQRLQRYTLTRDGGIAVRSFRIPDAETYIGAWQEPTRFGDVNPSSLIAAEGCDVFLARTGPTRFEGGTQGQGCRTEWRGASYVVSQALATENKLVNWDRGLAADGTLVWGPAAGGYEFRRIGVENLCDEPVHMLVYGDIYDREKFKAYAEAIWASGLYPKTQGYYVAVTPADDIFEGAPGKDHGMVLVRFPCHAAARAFWYSDDYAKIRPLREGIADFVVSVFKERPIPEYIRE